ncbi:helix-turn-helix domain-containing protein [Streptomyces sp. NBC_01795]|nr:MULTISPECIES: helix-turn-helix transcriptional regulator [unclassified Streptomyces]WSA95151.1 helix-turn-helix domain-containing protein [Streptomyces sp. NBC_01795]WSS12226.1 helix-turn-helix domain-containing protein [Streptomyces sp. NBC_01186]
MSIPSSLGEDVRRVRQARRISQTAFASATGYTQSYVSRVESGECRGHLWSCTRHAYGCKSARPR